MVVIKSIAEKEVHIVHPKDIKRISSLRLFQDEPTVGSKILLYSEPDVELRSSLSPEEILHIIQNAGAGDEDADILQAIRDARAVQEELWQDQSLTNSTEWDARAWESVFAKRLYKIREIDMSHPSALVELRKRILQQGALSIASLQVIKKIQQNGK